MRHTRIQRRVTLALPSLIAIGITTQALAGPLTPPPGAPSSTNITLGEIEPRTPIANTGLLIIINQPGSYFLTENINTSVSAIAIQTDGVTLDLNGFTITGDGAGLPSEVGVFITATGGPKPVVIKNGYIQNFAGPGINSPTPEITVVLDRIHISDCLDGALIAGAAQVSNASARNNEASGFNTGSGATFTNCIARDNGADGFNTSVAAIEGSIANGNNGFGFALGSNSTIHNSAAASNGSVGIQGFNTAVTNCTTIANISGGIEITVGALIADCRTGQEPVGINVGLGSTVVNSTARACTTGFIIGEASTVAHCTARDASADGFNLAPRVNISNSHADSTVTGFRAAAGCRLDLNTATNNVTGFSAPAGALLTRNAASANTTNFDAALANIGPIESNAATATSPWANFTY
ncbi:MAG: right-handed parallel beta-helix repeat-containing protein [Planctomycetota bacterium]